LLTVLKIDSEMALSLVSPSMNNGTDITSIMTYICVLLMVKHALSKHDSLWSIYSTLWI